MNVLFAGGWDLAGACLADRLIAEGHRVCWVTSCGEDSLWNKRYKGSVYRGALTREEYLRILKSNSIDAVIFLTASLRENLEELPEYESQIGELTDLLGALRNHPVKSLVYLSSLELDYDYASYDGSRNANYYIRYSGDPIDIEGYPSELGIWIYAPEGTANYIPYIQVSYWNGSDYATAYYALTPQTDDPNVSGIDWTGWMYCYADCTNLWQYIDEEHPLKLIPGNGLVWLSYQPGGPNGGRYDGSLYFDNFRVVYGTNMDDLFNP